MSYNRKLLWLLIITTALRVIAAAFTELGNDEVYYWTYAQHLQWNYFDHPPMVAIWIRIFTANLWLENYEFFIRFGSVIGCFISTLLLFNLVKILHSQRAAWMAACLYNASIYVSILTGVFILPDSPQMIFWCGCLYLLMKIGTDPDRWLFWILFGICAGLCVMSKVHGIFIWFGLGLFIIFKGTNYLKKPQLYISAIITAIIISPVIIWNISNHFITYRFHSGRIISNIIHPDLIAMLGSLAGQVLYSNPLVFIIIVASLIAWRKGNIQYSPLLGLYNFIALPMIAILIIISLIGDTLPHWSGPAYVTLIPLASIFLSEKKSPSIYLRYLKWGLSFVIACLIGGILVTNFFPGSIGKNNNKELGAGDFTLDMYGWKQAGVGFGKLYKDEQKSGLMPSGTPVVCYNWFPAAHEYYYFCKPLNIKIIGLGPVNNLHHFIWINQYNKPGLSMEKAYCIVPSSQYHYAKKVYTGYYKRCDSITTINIYRGGKICEYFTVFRLGGWEGKILVPDNIGQEIKQ